MAVVTPEELKAKSAALKKAATANAIKNRIGHIAPSLSCAEILTVLYYSVMRCSEYPSEETDHFILSKAHGCYVLYEILSDLGRLPRDSWENISTGKQLSGCVERRPEWGLEASCGALGHGFPMAVGLAWGLKLQKKPYRVYCLVGDGELQEGTIWESAQAAAHFQLDNLCLIVDGNGLQAMDFLKNVLTTDDPRKEYMDKFSAFGFQTISCNGHDPAELLKAFDQAAETRKTPSLIYAETVKGYGLKAIENIAKFHYRLPNEDELRAGWRDE